MPIIFARYGIHATPAVIRRQNQSLRCAGSPVQGLSYHFGARLLLQTRSLLLDRPRRAVRKVRVDKLRFLGPSRNAAAISVSYRVERLANHGSGMHPTPVAMGGFMNPQSNVPSSSTNAYSGGVPSGGMQSSEVNLVNPSAGQSMGRSRT